MINADLSTQIHTELSNLEPDAQRRVLEYVLSLKQNRKGMSGAELKQHLGAISSQDAKSMMDAIEGQLGSQFQ